PIGSPITNETQLRASIPNASYVEKYDSSTDKYWRWNGSTCQLCDLAVAGTCGPGMETSPCFSVDPSKGLGFVAVVNGASQYTVLGADGSTTLTLTAAGDGTPPSLTGRSLISLPFCPDPTTGPTTAKQLLDSIGLANVQRVERYRCDTDLFEFYTGRSGQS